MNPKTPYGWYNMIIRGYPYNKKTAYLLDHNFKPSQRLLSTLVSRRRTIKMPEVNILRKLFRP